MNSKKLLLIILPIVFLFFASPASALLGRIEVDLTAPSNPSGTVYKNMYVGQTEQLKATNHDTGADITSAVNWWTADQSVVTVSNGLVTAIGVGKATVSATASCTFCSATNAPFNITLAPAGTTPFANPTATNLPPTTTKTTAPVVHKCPTTGLVTCTGTPECPCTICTLFQLITNIYSFVVWDIATPLAVLALLIGGILIMVSAGNANTLGTGKKILFAAVIGLVLVFCSYLIIDFVLHAIGYTKNWTDLQLSC
ncbi:MAG: Ig-like domain-containing protein [Candidatus Staskawiczbacteria bacterium]|nr:Ig-like domain-containing protein [Candidatus Staskawiczbacteria bacterium]